MIQRWQLQQECQVSQYRRAKLVRIDDSSCYTYLNPLGERLTAFKRQKDSAGGLSSITFLLKIQYCCLQNLHTHSTHCFAEKGKQETGHGIESIVEVLGFIIGLITNDTGELGHADMSIFGLELMYTALNGGQTGEAFQEVAEEGKAQVA